MISLYTDQEKLIDLYKKRDQMFHEIVLMLEDGQLMHEIGDKTYAEFQTQILVPVIEMFFPHNTNEVWKYRGVKLPLIQYYCSVFNSKVSEVGKQ